MKNNGSNYLVYAIISNIYNIFYIKLNLIQPIEKEQVSKASKKSGSRDVFNCIVAFTLIMFLVMKENIKINLFYQLQDPRRH